MPVAVKNTKLLVVDKLLLSDYTVC